MTTQSWDRPPTPSPQPRRRKRGWIIGAAVAGLVLAAAATIAAVAGLANLDTTGTAQPPSVSQPAHEEPPGPATTDTFPTEPAEDLPSDEGVVGTSALITDEYNDTEGEITLEKMDRAPGAVHLYLSVKSTKGNFDINPYDFYLRKKNDERITDYSFDHMRNPTIDATTLRAGKRIRGWLSYDTETVKGYTLVYAPGLQDSVFEWKLG